MKKILFIILICLPIVLYGQATEQKTLAKFIITDATENGVDITPIIVNAGAYTVFYTSEDDGLIYMANVWAGSNSQSFGPMYGVEIENIDETSESYKTDIFTFNWRYYNDYDTKSGTAKVQVIKIYKPQGIAFSVKIIPEDLDIIIYKGYMEGTVNFERFNRSPKKTESKRFRMDYNYVAFYDVEKEEWSDWSEGNNTFVINYNSNGDIAHYKPNGEMDLYKNISSVEDGYTDSGEHYQIITALDEEGFRFIFQFFDNSSIGLKMIYGDIMIQFSEIK